MSTRPPAHEAKLLGAWEKVGTKGFTLHGPPVKQHLFMSDLLLKILYLTNYQKMIQHLWVRYTNNYGSWFLSSFIDD
jgi:hypothetical protein